LKGRGFSRADKEDNMEGALSIFRSWRLLLIISGVALLLAGFYFHNSPLQVAGFLIAVFGAFGNTCSATSGLNSCDRKDDHHGQ
jgi:hypothetical protein